MLACPGLRVGPSKAVRAGAAPKEVDSINCGAIENQKH